jgi:thiamine transport system permease protein
MVRASQAISSYQYILKLFLYFVFFLPFFYLFFSFYKITNWDFSEILWALKNTFYQSIGSALLSCLFGFLIALGLTDFKNKRISTFVEFLFLTPVFIPSIFIINFLLTWLEPFTIGVLGVILTHTFIYFGFVAVYFKKTIINELSGNLSLAYLEGASFFQTAKSLISPLLVYAWRIFLLIFIFSFMSFSVPLVVGGGRGTTLEVLIYEKIKIEGDLGQALLISFLQAVFLFFFMSFQKKDRTDSNQSFGSIKIFRFSAIKYLLLFFLVFFYFSFFYGMIAGWQQVLSIEGLNDQIIGLIMPTFFIGILGGLTFLVLYFLQSLIPLTDQIHFFLGKIFISSGALSAIVYYQIFPSQFILFALVLCLVTLFYPSLLSLIGLSSLMKLKTQILVAQQLGASYFLIYRKVIFPQIVKPASWMAGVAAFWCMGDFAVTKIISGKQISLAILAENLLSSYRIDASFAVTGVILLLGFINFIFFGVIGHVLDQKSL